MNDEIELPPMPPAGSHPAPEALLEAARKPDEPRHEPILRHAAVCADCSEELVHARAFLETPRLARGRARRRWNAFGPSPGAPAPRLWRAPAWALAAAAVVASVALLLHRRAPGEIERGAASPAAAFAPAGRLSSPPVEFAFPSLRGVPVRVSLFDAARELEWTSPPTRAGRVALPARERGRLAPGRRYFWTVLAPDRTEPVQTFEIAPR